MADAPEQGVTNSWGEVHGYKGLFVLDASIFPQSVGVNPSATIAAIAERNVEHHIRQCQQSRWQAPESEGARIWAADRQRILDPLAAIENQISFPGVREPRAEPIGFKFEEVMEGFHADGGRTRDYERAEELGRFENASIRAEIRAQVPDLSKMLDDPKHEIALSGTVRVNNWPARSGSDPEGTGPRRYETTGWLHLLVRGEPQGPARDRLMSYHLPRLARGEPPDAARERFMSYHLEFDQYELNGFKRLRERAGSDAWRDTTTLYITIRKRADPLRQSRIGIMRVGIDDFLTKQMRSFAVTGTKDEERIGWAFSTFASFFFSNLEKVYLPEIDRVRAFP